jgi:hypothetical protein
VPPRLPIVDEPTAGDGAAGFARAVARRFVARLPLVLVILVLTQVFVRIAHMGPMQIGPWDVKATTHGEAMFLTYELSYVLLVSIAVLAADEAVARGARRGRAYSLAVLAGCLAGAIVDTSVQRATGWREITGVSEDFAAMRPLTIFFSFLLYAGFACIVYVNEITARQALQRLRAAEVARAASRRRTVESRLQAMQARVEPQFLFNTLARVRDLHDVDPGAAARVLDDLIAYLRAALPHLRESTSTLGREAELARAYLAILREGVAGTPEFDAPLPEALRDAALPAMTLLPLVDLALSARRAGAATGGRLRLDAEAVGARLHITLQDTSDALTRTADGSPAARVLADRLDAVFGEQARLLVRAAIDGGGEIILEIPNEIPDLPDR